MLSKAGIRESPTIVCCDGGDSTDHRGRGTEATDVCLSLSPDTVSPPETIHVTVKNRGESPVTIYPDSYPLLYGNTEQGWSQIQIARRFTFTEPVLVEEEYSYCQSIPFSNWEPEPGTYLLAIDVESEYTEREEAHAVLSIVE